jgi:hypothetical protein
VATRVSCSGEIVATWFFALEAISTLPVISRPPIERATPDPWPGLEASISFCTLALNVSADA